VCRRRPPCYAPFSMTEALAATLDTARAGEILASARRRQAVDALLLAVWFGFNGARGWFDGRTVAGVSWLRGAAWSVGCIGVVAVVVVMAVSQPRTDREKLAGPRDALLRHYRAVLRQVTPNYPRWIVPLWIVGGLYLLGLAASEFVGEVAMPLSGLTVVAFATAICIRPLWNHFVGSRRFRAELATLPPPPGGKSVPPHVVAQARELLAAGSKIAAIKHLREAAGLGLAEAKAAVEALDKAPPETSASTEKLR
jgi:hypothetical protein